MLETFGVAPPAEAAYLATLRHPDASVAELAEHLGWSTDAVTSALDELARLSLLRPSLADPDVLRPVSPAIGLEALIARQQVELVRRRHQIEEGRAALQTLVAEYASNPFDAAGTAVDVLAGVDALREGLERLAYETHREVLALVPNGLPGPGNLAADKPVNQYLLQRGVHMRLVHLTSARNDRAAYTYARHLAKMGAQLRTVPVLPLQMVVFDQSHAVVPTHLEDSPLDAYVLRNPGAVAACLALFRQTWDAATDLGSQARTVQVSPTDQERALLQLLQYGDTDEQAGRKLGVSTRTIGRMAADLMSRLGARSRFQAGALAVAYGWLGGLPAGRDDAHRSKEPTR
ncbi:MAG TPA: LuxR C-terminal-related transcriptional regulator [Rugosimonospora sp.]|nr:LuxR C-terminal-related transcriptional regulator [Rugosimonospora sp.]